MSKKANFTLLGIGAMILAFVADAMAERNRENAMKAEIEKAVDKAVTEKFKENEEA